MSFTATLTRTGRTGVIRLGGGLDALTAPVLRDQVEQALGSGVDRLVLDITELGYLSSAGLRVLVFARQKLGDGVPIVLLGANETVKRTIRMVGFHYSVELR